MEKYDFKYLEEKWKPIFEIMNLYRTGTKPDAPKFYCLDFFPYPSGDGLSVGHCRNYIPTDVISRYMRMKGYNVLHPMGWDAFGLPAENYAIEQKVHPRVTTERNTSNYRRQLKLIETSYDWEREINSTDPLYYKWTQWFFLFIYKRGLVYQAVGSQWWCPKCRTILANEQVEAGKCWRCESLVTKKDLLQWFFKITHYADRLLEDLDKIDWPESIKTMQRNWIGRSEGVSISFFVEHETHKHEIPVFTTRIDTIFGVTFLALAPEHPLVSHLTIPEKRKEVETYIEAGKRKSEIDRLSLEKEKTGVSTGSFAINPLSKEKIPIWVGDYVLLSYGTGAVMGVPAHDTRDFEFAKKYGLEIKEVIKPKNAMNSMTELEHAFVDYGIMVNSKEFSGLSSEQGIEKLTREIETRKIGERKVIYRMRDWLISRQRYWGAPIPIIHCEKCGAIPVPEEELPVQLPEIESFEPEGTGKSPLSKVESFVRTNCPKCKGHAKRETDTLDGFACSSWYFLRFTSPTYDKGPFEPSSVEYWMPVDLYVGGAEHAVMHLLYARFWTKVFYDAGLIPFDEPFPCLKNQGLLLSYDGQKMSKSKGNVITPDEVVSNYGVDALRLYILFLGPFEAELKWDENGIKGVYRFLSRLWNFAHSLKKEPGTKNNHETCSGQDTKYWQHRTIKKVTEDIQTFNFNTAVSSLMEFLNYLQDCSPDSSLTPALEVLLRLLSPMAPFITSELWERFGHTENIHTLPWLEYDESALKQEKITVVIQVNGKVRERLEVPPNISEEKLKEIALSSSKVKKFIEGVKLKETFFVPGKLINIVVE